MLLGALLQNSPRVLQVLGDPDVREIDSLEYDSRRPLSAGCLFFCMTGAALDGHSYAPQVYEKGCRAFVCERVMDLPTDCVQIVTDNARLALAELSAAFYGHPAKELTVIGITGTKGKTTTAILLSGLLNENGISCGYIGSNGVDFADQHHETVNTTPESRELHRFFRMMADAGVTHVVMEVSSQALMTGRVRGIEFDTCLYTNLAEDHISPVEHASFEEYLSCKRRLFTDHGCRRIITNLDDPHWQAVSYVPGVPVIGYAIDTSEDTAGEEVIRTAWRGMNIRPFRSETALGIDFDCLHDGERTSVRLRTPGDFSVYNGLCAIAAASVYGVTPAQCAVTLAHLSIRGRFEIVDAVDGVTFLIDYAHNGLSLESALTQLREYRPARLICLFGSVGGRTQNRRRELAEVSSRLADLSILTSDNPDFEDPGEILRDILSWFDRSKPYYVIPDREEALRAVVSMVRPGDIVLLAGKGHETYQLIRGEKVPFSERAILLEEAQKLRQQLPL